MKINCFTVLKIVLLFLLWPMISVAQESNDPIVVGANIGNVPWEFQNTDGTFIGFEIDLVNEIGKRLNRPVNIINVPFNGLFAAVQSGRIDIAMSSIGITDKRLESVAFTQPFYDSDQSLTVVRGSGITSLEDLRGQIVAADTGSTGDIWATANQEKYGFAEIRRYEGLAPAMLDVVIGRVKGYISDIPALQYYTKDKPNLEVVERIPTGGRYALMLGKNSAILNDVNDTISILKEEGFVNQLHLKWYGTLAEESTSTARVVPMPTTSDGLIFNFVETFLNMDVFLQTYPMLIDGLFTTIQLGILAIVAGLILGLILALLKLYAHKAVRIIVKAYIDVFRSIPLLVLLIIIFYALPFVGISLSPFYAAAVALTVVSGAYTAEIFRAGIEAIPKGQFEASEALGLSYKDMMVDVILPQAIKVVIPPLTNNCINVIKDTALASVVAMPDLLKQATQAQAVAANPTPLIAAAVIYLAFLLPLVLWVSGLEKKFKAGDTQ
ncbi:ABC transporter substrate-binding protein/permease [Emcibacteraceae bacterium]|mgnify:CR=1 FL=1|nr:ABC transporter substrate-binding protein/permease [Emcibacteraceae bacterium]MDG1021229.1 ABC transporter substrate-binding protein/permease [Emcibacteraceae bacterium]MDG1725913.1 ABC transporter substrate-binding protein/permease [Emcibacteraceae bacterium]